VHFQEHLDSSPFFPSPVIPADLTNQVSPLHFNLLLQSIKCFCFVSFFFQLAQSLDRKFSERIDVVRKLRDTVEENWESFTATSSLVACCEDVSTGEINPNFATEVRSSFYNECFSSLNITFLV
jgi:hypothetical protein